MEVEIKLSVRGVPPDAAERLLRRLRDRPALGGYRLETAFVLHIHDVYYDTPDRMLGRRRVALRLRRQDDTALITVKAGRRQAGGLAVRDELELPFTPAHLDRALTYLRQFQAVPAGAIDGAVDPLRFGRGEACGALVPVLSTHTRRWARSARRPAHGATVAELALDRVTYDGVDAPFFDVEVEQRGEGTAADLQALQAALTTLVPELAPAAESKVARGLRIMSETEESAWQESP